MVSTMTKDIQFAKITISIPVEEVPSEMGRILNSPSANIDDMYDEISELRTMLSNNNLSADFLDRVEQLRTRLFRIDVALTEIQEVIAGYLQIKSGETKEKKEEIEIIDDEEVESA
jgi:Mg2+ and Co2+ transporter CorA